MNDRGNIRGRAFVPRLVLAAAATFGFAWGSGGCYERVIGVSGPGAANYQGDVYEPNLKDDDHIPIIDDIGAVVADDQ